MFMHFPRMVYDHVMRPTRVFSCPLRRAQVKQQMRRTQIFGSLQKWVASQRLCFCSCWLFMSDHDCSTMHVKSFSGWMYSNLLLTRLWIMFLFPQPSRVLDANPKKSSLWSPQTTVGHMGYTDRFQTTQVIYVVNVFQRFPTPSTRMPQTHTNKNQAWMLSSNTARLQCSLHITGVIPWCLASLLEWSPCFLCTLLCTLHITIVNWIWNPNITSKLNPTIVI